MIPFPYFHPSWYGCHSYVNIINTFLQCPPYLHSVLPAMKSLHLAVPEQRVLYHLIVDGLAHPLMVVYPRLYHVLYTLLEV